MRKNLTDRTIRSLKPAPKDQRYEVWDAALPAFGARVDDRGRVNFILMKRLDGKLRRWTLGRYEPGTEVEPALGGALTLAGARRLAWAVADAAARGVDLRDEREARRREEARKREDTLAAVASDFIKRHARPLRSAPQYEGVIERHLLPAWGGRPVAEITRRHVIALLEAIVDRSGPAAAHKALSVARKLFNWAIARDAYGLAASPCDRVRPKDIVGKLQPRQRVLSDDELRRVWRSAGTAGYPFGPLVKMLIVTGARRNEVAGARWSEVDLDAALWTIPPERMKGGAPHEVPLPPLAVELLRSLPRFAGNGYVFTTTGGARPMSGFSKMKRRLDGLIVERMRGEAKEHVELAGWRLHDLRRTMRSHLSALPVQDIVRELAIAHRRPGLHQVYDLHQYRAEKHLCFDLWAKRLLLIVEPAGGDNVVPMRGEARA